MASSLLLADTYELLDPTVNTQFSLAPDSDFGEPVPDLATVPGVLLSGDMVAGTRSGNRTIRLKVVVRATDRVTLASYVNDLIQVVDAQLTGSFTLQWTPSGGLPVTFDCFRGSWTRERIFTRELQLVTVVTLTCQAYPFGRSDAPVTVAAASPQLQVDSLNSAPTNGTLDTSLKYEGTGSASVTLTRNTFAGPRGTTMYYYTSPTVSRAVSSTNLSSYASVGVRFYWPAPTVGAPWTTNVTLTLSDGTRSATATATVVQAGGSTAWTLLFFSLSALAATVSGGALPNLAAITSWKLDLSTGMKTLSIAPASSPTIHYDDLRAFPSSSTAISTGTGAVVTIPAVIGTAPALAALTVTEGGGSMTNLLLHRPPVDQDTDAAILVALSGTPKTATVAAANNTFKGTYSVVVLLGTPGSGSRTVSVQFDHKQGSTVLATQTVSATYTTPTGKFAIMHDYITLPLVPVPDENTTDTLVITVTNSGGTADTFTDVALIDNRGQLVLLGSLPSGTKTVYVDEPDPIAELGQIYASATDRTAAQGLLGWGLNTRIGYGAIVFEPGDNRLLAASPDGVVPTITGSYDPRWLDERTL